MRMEDQPEPNVKLYLGPCEGRMVHVPDVSTVDFISIILPGTNCSYVPVGGDITVVPMVEHLAVYHKKESNRPGHPAFIWVRTTTLRRTEAGTWGADSFSTEGPKGPLPVPQQDRGALIR